MQPLFLAVQVIPGAAADALHPEGSPLGQYLPHAHNAGLAGDQYIKVAAKTVLQRRHLEQLCHQLIGIHAAL